MSLDLSQQTFSIAILKQNIEMWVRKRQTIKLQCQFRYPPTILKNISKQHIIEILLCSTLKQLNNFIIGDAQEKEPLIKSLGIKIRQYYYEMNVKNIWKQQFNFQFSVVYLVKVMAAFCHQFFQQIEVDLRFEGESFIILMHIFLGTNVGYKSYKILQKKYIGKSILKALKKKKLMHKQSDFNDKNFQMRKKQSIKTKTQSDEFKNQLIMSLYVEPLPTLQVKRKSLHSLAVPKNNLEKFDIHRRLQQIEYQLKKKIVKSTQISSSMKAQLKKYNSFIAMNNKPFNINHRLPFDCKKVIAKIKDKKTCSNDLPIMKKKEDQKQNKKVQHEEWLRIISKMKSSIIEQNAKIDSNANRDKKQNQEQKVEQILSKKESKTEYNQSDRCQLNKAKQIKKVTNSQLPLEIKPPKGVEVDSVFENQLQTKDILPNSKQLKTMKKSFQYICQERSKKVQYSIFALPSLKTTSSFRLR